VNDHAQFDGIHNYIVQFYDHSDNQYTQSVYDSHSSHKS
jgi:hypothetical protein